LRTSDFDYALPQALIAQTPIEPRDTSRLLVVHRQSARLEHRSFSDLPDYLRPGDLLVANDSRVIPARLYAHKVPSGGRVEMLLLNKQDERTWEVLLKPGRRVKPGALLALDLPPDSTEKDNILDPRDVRAEVIGTTPAGGRVVKFTMPVDAFLDTMGVAPLPPYIHTPLSDPERYQTVFARVRGSVAAPTAGLHFSQTLLEKLAGSGVYFVLVTLHVSLDTFRPVLEDHIEDHSMHSEYCELPADTCAAVNQARCEGRRVVAVGTTTVRVLETAWLRSTDARQGLKPFVGTTRLFIHPRFHFQIVDALITNFHLPRSTLLMLVSAFGGKDLVDRAYAEAIRLRYRFYSFGDAMLFL